MIEKNKPQLTRRAFMASVGSAVTYILLPSTATADVNNYESKLDYPHNDVILAMEPDGSILVIQDSVVTSLQITDDARSRIVTATNLTTGEISETVLDKTRGILHSPFTESDIDIRPFIASYTEEPPAEARLNAPARTYERFEFSWQSIRNFGGVSATITDIVILILSVIGNIEIPSSAKDIIGTALRGVGNLVPNDPNHGIYVVMVLLEWYENGKLVKADYNFDEIGIY